MPLHRQRQPFAVGYHVDVAFLFGGEGRLAVAERNARHHPDRFRIDRRECNRDRIGFPELEA